MSFLYARKLDDRIYVLADTKISYDTIESDIIIKAIGRENEYLLRNYGIIKNVIINRDICVGFAGSIRDFNELLEYIDNNKITSIEDINEKALEIHLKNRQETDFIISQCNAATKKLYVVKDEKIKECDSCWIGSKKCFDSFQEKRYKMPPPKVYDLETKKDIELNDNDGVWINDSEVFKNVVNSNIDNSVGLFTIRCLGNKDGFKYFEEMSTYQGFKPYEIKPGESALLYEDTANGGYTYFMYESNEYVNMYIDQLGKGIVFKPSLAEDDYNHLRFPTIEKIGVEKFVENYGLKKSSIQIIKN